MSSATPAGAAAVSSSSLYTGQPKGEAWLLTHQKVKSVVFDKEFKFPNRSITCDQYFSFVESSLMPDSEAYASFELCVTALQEVTEQVSLGFWPLAELPQSIREHLRRVHPAVRDLQGLIQLELAEVIAIAAKVQAATPAGEDSRSYFFVAAAGQPLRTETQAQGRLAAAASPMPTSVRTNDRYTPAKALYRLLLAALSLMFKYAGQQELAQFLSLATNGMQGERDINAWQRFVQKRQTFVSHLAQLQPVAGFQVFLAGLNDRELENRGWRAYENNPAIQMEDLAMLLMGYDADMHQRQSTVLTAVVTGATASGLIAAAAGSAQGVAFTPAQLQQGLSAGAPAAGTRPSALSNSNTGSSLQQQDAGDEYRYHSMIPNARVIEWAEGHGQTPEHTQQILGWCATAKKHPAASSALCRLANHSIGSSIKPHTNAGCKVQQKEKQASSAGPQPDLTQQMRGMQLNNQQPQAMAAVQPPAPSSSGYVSITQEQFGSLMAMLAQQGTGLPQAVPKATAGGRGDRQQQPRSTGAGGPCHLCGFAAGHGNGVCYCANPAFAKQQRGANWGPGPETPQQGVLMYLVKCREQELPINLKRCQQVLQQMMGQQSFPAELRQFIQRAGQMPTQAMGGIMGSPSLQQFAAGSAAAYPPGLPATPQQHAQLQQLAAVPQQQYQLFPPGAEQQNAAAGSSSNLPYTVTPPSAAGSSWGAYTASAALTQPQQPAAGAPAASTSAAAQTRSAAARGGSSKLVSFAPKQQYLPDPNTATGGRHRGAAALQQKQQPADPAEPPQLDELLRVMQDHSRVGAYLQDLQRWLSAQPGTQVPGPQAAAAQAANCSSGCSSSTVPTSQAAAAQQSSSSSSSTSGRRTFDMRQALNARPMFPIKEVDYDALLQPMTKLILIEDMPPGQPAHVSLRLDYEHGRPLAIDRVAADNGCNGLHFTQLWCDSNGIPWQPEEMPCQTHSDGVSRPTLLGRTKPMTIILGEHTPAPLVIHQPEGFDVMKGDAGGLYNLCLGTDAVKWWFAHVNPVYQHFVWFPHAPQDLSVMNGVPVQCHYPASTFQAHKLPSLSSSAQIQQQQGIAACCQVPPAAAQQSSCSQPEAVQQQPPTQQSASASSSTAAAAPAAATASVQTSAAAAPQQQPSCLQRVLSAIAMVVCLLLAGFHLIRNVARMRYPSRFVSWVVNQANWPVWWQRRRQVIRQRLARFSRKQQPTVKCRLNQRQRQRLSQPCKTSSAPQQQSVPEPQQPRARKHRQGEWRLQRAYRAIRKQRWRLLQGTAAGRLRFSHAAMSARVLLLFLLLLTMCTVCVSGMQTSMYIGSSSAGLISSNIHSPQYMQQQANQPVSMLLGYELGERRRSCFRSGSASCQP